MMLPPINLWNPKDLGFALILITAYLLGIVHGITPDEHTWPITFSYAVGSASTKGGMKAGLIFSTGFTIQRSIISEIAYLALVGIFITATAFGVTYIFVGIAMAVAGLYIKRKSVSPHLHILERRLNRIFGIHKNDETDEMEMSHKKSPIDERGEDLKPVPSKLALLHGFIAGFGFGAFALIIYTVLAPEMPSIWLGWVPGFLFGIGTMTMQVIFGATFGRWLSKAKNLTARGINFVARSISSDVLLYGGTAFVVAGAAILAFPAILTYGIITPIKVHNLHDLGVGFFLVIIAVCIIGFLSYRRSMRRALKLYSRKRVKMTGRRNGRAASKRGFLNRFFTNR
jgi:hypothetical protein